MDRLEELKEWKKDLNQMVGLGYSTSRRSIYDEISILNWAIEQIKNKPTQEERLQLSKAMYEQGKFDAEIGRNEQQNSICLDCFYEPSCESADDSTKSCNKFKAKQQMSDNVQKAIDWIDACFTMNDLDETRKHGRFMVPLRILKSIRSALRAYTEPPKGDYEGATRDIKLAVKRIVSPCHAPALDLAIDCLEYCRKAGE